MYVAFLVPLYALSGAVFFLALTTEFKPVDEFSFVRLLILLLFAPIILKYLFHLLIVPWYPAVESLRARRHPAVPPPLVSVLIPAWNEEVGIVATVRSVLRSEYPSLEVIVLNDGSTDTTHEEIVKLLTDHQKFPGPKPTLRYESLTNGGKARALNHGLGMAQGEIIVTIDADSIMDRSTIRNLIKHFADPRVMSVAGNVVIGNRHRPIGIMQQLEYVYGFYFKRADSILNAVYIVGGAAAAYRKDLVIALGGFDEDTITEDIELSTRIQFNGHQVRYAADAIVYTEGPSDFMGLCRQRLRWKFGRLQTFYKYRSLFFSLDRRHNPYLSFFILPIAFFAEVLLFFEGILLLIFYTYTISTNDYLPLALVISLLSIVVWLQVLTDRNMRYHRNLFLLAPIAWILFYIMDLVEYQALVRSIARFIRKKDPVWQRWKRHGITIEPSTDAP